MTKITALLHTHNDALRLRRTLQSLRPCDEVLIIDQGSEDDTARIAREYGATFKTAIPGVTAGAYVMDAAHDWIFCLRPSESLSDDLEAALFEWKQQEPGDAVACYSVPIRSEDSDAWQKGPPEVRLVNRNQMNWIGELPPNENCCPQLGGDLLCFAQP